MGSLVIGKNVVIGKSVPINPLTIINSVPAIFYVNADVGVTTATGVSVWTDQSGNGNSFAQSTGANQPALITNDTDFGGRNSIYNTSGGTLWMANSWIPPAPGTTNAWFFLVFKQISWTASDFIFCAASASSVISLFQSGSSPSLTMANTSVVNSNTGATIGSSVRGEVFFSSSTSDYIKLGSTTTTGSSAGNSAGSVGLRIFTRNGGTQGCDVKIACIGAWAGNPTAGEKTALNAWVTSYYGGTVGV